MERQKKEHEPTHGGLESARAATRPGDIGMQQPDFDDLLDLVGSVYDIALSDDGWDALLSRLTGFLGGNGAIFFTQDRDAADLDFAHLVGLPEDALTEYQSHFAQVDVGIDTLLSLPPGSVTTDESTPSQVFRRSEIYNDFRRRWGVERFVGADVFRDERRFGVLSVQAPCSRRPFGATEALVLERLLPHVRRAVEIRSRLDHAKIGRLALEEVVENLVVGVVILDERGEVTHANAAARRIDERQDGLRLTDRRLRAMYPDDDRDLQIAIANAMAIANRTDDHAAATLSLRRAADDATHAVLVNPGPGKRSSSPFRAAAAIVMIGDPESSIGAAPELIARLYGLTMAEARLARAVACGASLDAFAQERGISVSTARWTMKRILAKTGARRQADLVRLLLSGPAGSVAPR